MYRQSHAGEETGEQILIFSQTAKLHFHFRIFVIKIKATVAVQHLNFTLDDLTLPSNCYFTYQRNFKKKASTCNSSSTFNPPNQQRLIMFIGHLTVRGIIHYMTQGKGGDTEMKEQLLFSQGAVLTSTRWAWLPSKTLLFSKYFWKCCLASDSLIL